jgi:hypothetical protein
MVDYTTRTQHAIRRALATEPTERNRCERILVMLADGQWVGGLKLALKAGGLGYRSRITELRQSGVPIECRPSPSRPKGERWHEYRLAPVNGR